MPAPPFDASDATRVRLPDGRVVISFGGCNYLGLANHPAVVEAVASGLRRFGVSATASRETTGNATPHEQLERELAAFLGFESGLLLPDGYLANVAACQGLATLGVGRAILDARAHVSLRDAAMAAGLRVETFEHADVDDLARTLAADLSIPALVMTDGVFTADGKPAPVVPILERLGDRDWVLLDDCHALGVIGPGGRGSVAAAGGPHPRAVTTSSLAKGLGAAGGIVAGPARLIEQCVRASSYVCTTPIAPALAQGARAALQILQAEPGRVERVIANAARLRQGLAGIIPDGALGWPTPIAAFSFADAAAMQTTAAGLLADGFRVSLQRYPGGPSEWYFRISVNAEHTPEMIDAMLGALRRRVPSEIRTRPIAGATASPR